MCSGPRPSESPDNGVKLVIVILLLVAVSFVAVMVYGVTRDEPPPATTAKRDECGRPPPIDGDDPDPDVLEDWCPPDFGSLVDKARLRFTPSLDVEQPEVSVNGVRAETRRVAPAEDRVRIARVALVGGRAAKVTSQRLDGESDTICLCRADQPVDPDDFPGCGSRWLAKQVSSKCKDGSLGVLPFGPLGGSLSFAATRPARLVVNPAAQAAAN